jgi:putative FmdB family regulatory protein
MPIYEYECDACGQRFEVIKKFSDPHAETCAICGEGPVHRLLSSSAIQFKGSGFYITDYAQKGRSDTGAGSAGKTDGAEKSDTEKRDTEKKGAEKKDTAKSEKTGKSDAKSSGSAATATPAKTPAAKSD